MSLLFSRIYVVCGGLKGRYFKEASNRKPFKLKLISIQKQDPGPHTGNEDKVNISIFYKLKHKKLSFFLSIFLLFSIPFSVANAGILSFLGSFFETTVVYEKKYVNSQTAAVLEAAVNYDPNPSKGGGDITIIGKSALLPESGPSGTIAEVEDGPVAGQISVYVVREGDSISEIAKMFSVNVNTIIWANDIGNGEIIREGQQLVILPVSGLEYTVKKGDTTTSIAKKYSGNVDEILEFNNIKDESSLITGNTIIIPGGKKTTPRYSKKSSVKVVRGTNVPAYDGYYARPVNNKGRKSQGLHGYNAVDLPAPYGTPIVASASGRVVISKNSGWNGGYGIYIVIEHDNGTQTLYSHNSGNIVKRGQRVVQGQVIGYIGSTGRSTGPHVHFEVRGAKNPF